MRKRKLIFGTAAGFALGCSLLILSDKLAVLCPLRRLFGILCPFCGMTRASFRLMLFDFSGALEKNPAALFIWAYLVKLYFDFAVNYIKNGKFIKTRLGKIDILAVVLLVTWGIVRNILGI